MARGNRRQPIFCDDDDRRYFLAALAEACGRTGWRIHAWVLMGNHYHLLIETPEPNLVEGMKWLQNTYTRRFNTRHRLWKGEKALLSKIIWFLDVGIDREGF